MGKGGKGKEKQVGGKKVAEKVKEEKKDEPAPIPAPEPPQAQATVEEPGQDDDMAEMGG